MALTKEEMQDLIERNRLEKQATRAQDEMAVRNRSGERWLNREQAANAAAAERIAEARQRRIDRNRQIADGDRGRFSAFETRGLLGLKHTQYGDVAEDNSFARSGLQQHELAMAQQEGQNKIGVAHEKAFGMRGQGVEAAEFGYKGVQDTNATKLSIAEKQESGLTEREKAALEANQKLETIKGQNSLGVAKEQGKATVDAAKANADAAAARAQAENATKIEIAKGNNAATIAAAEARGGQAEAARIRRFDEMAAQGKFMMAGITADKWMKMTPEQKEAARKQILGQMNELYGTPAAPAQRQGGLSAYETK